jgi:hypothetical protein
MVVAAKRTLYDTHQNPSARCLMRLVGHTLPLPSGKPPGKKERGRFIPFKSAKYDRAPRSSTHDAAAKVQPGQKDSCGEKGSEPKDHCGGFGGQDGEFVRGGRQETRAEGEVRHGEGAGPD